ncbi:ABC transporter permease [Halanaerobiaceae bacterium Z-7014]|uniref:ABC transporter permease n=1 Tax=Halonatronomonas betaini TaxID=2778430 RepID=A0A931B0H3_9FIRM|nr:ABC transporter permease [Halonatronomonas betaini]MBF8438158.1 ABC transporter permease [Halonatronomonas betaini]
MGKGQYIAKRLIQLVITFLIILTILFFLFRLALPDPTAALVMDGLSAEEQAMVRERFGLDRPIVEQYFIYLRNFMRGEFGLSFHYKSPVFPILMEKLFNTLALMLPAIFVSYLIGPLLGVLLSWKRGSNIEFTGIIGGLTLRSAPVFWTGMIFIMVFGIWLGILPTSGMRTLPYEASSNLDKILTLDYLRHLILPMFTIAIYYLGLPMLIMRNTMLEIMGEDFIELCQAKGLSERKIMYKHVARNALLPVVTQAAITIGLAVGGQVVVEVVFSWPGLGREMIQAVRTSDFPMAQSAFMMMAGLVLVMNTVADLLYSYLDPRVVLKGGDK